ncbi:SDR family oxidoreductase [Bradyrhizobium sp. HKCCYLR20261]|uniref:SDR family oxidoreductase n=1 Tax=Bradyrhizobium sp. HKCCYLR20261 TaxID=3420760 RepID=UPI003EBE2337
MSQSVLVSGAAGQLGRAVIRHLLTTLGVPASRIIATTRKPEQLQALAAQGVQVRSADFDDAGSLVATFAGAERMLLISTDALDRPGRRLQQHKNAIAAAEQAGVSHVIYTSMPKPEGSPILLAPDHALTEAALKDSRLAGWTVLRNHWYFENLMSSLPQILGSGRWFTADQGGASADIARDDLARAAATVLAGSAGGKQVFTLSGGEALTKAQKAQIISAAVGKPIEVVQVPLEGLIQGMVGAGLPRPLAEVFASFEPNTAQGLVAGVTGDYQTITGVAPQSFADWVEKTKPALT